MSGELANRPRRPMVLVVEDEVLIALEMQRVLEAEGFDVLGPAPTVKRALELLSCCRPDAATLDVRLRDEMVTPVARALSIRNIPFVLTSGFNQTELAGEDVLADVPNLGKLPQAARLAATLNRLLETSEHAMQWLKRA